MVGPRLDKSFLAAAVAVLGTIAFAPVPAGAAQPGHPWSVVPSPNEGKTMNRVASISCVDPKSCVVVGYWAKASPSQEPQTLAEVWNGSNWSLTASPNTGKYGDVLNGVSCTDATGCIAVGDQVAYSASSQNFKTLAESWNGTAWSVIPSPSRFNSILYGVSCVSATRCVAVGGYGKDDEPLAEPWNGTSWSVAVTPNPKGGGSLSGVSCVRSDDCTAVGSTTKGATLVETWNGHAWSIVQSPNQSGDDWDGLDAVSCSNSTTCMAVGSYFKNGRAHPLAELWSGSARKIVPTTDGDGTTIVSLNAVSCSTSSGCVAVGGDVGTLIETWNGTSWTNTASQNKGDGGDLSGVSCPTATKCVAGGFYETLKSEKDETLIESD